MDETVVPVTKRRLENLVVRKFALERTVLALRKQNDLQRTLLRSALHELARERGIEPAKFRRQWISERNGSQQSQP